MAKRNLTTKVILEKEFKTAIRGFNTDEVDEFLDMVIRDYDSFEAEIAELQNKVSQLESQLENSQQTGAKQSQAKAFPQAKSSNFDILKRISNLEKAVFGDQISHNEGPISQGTHASRQHNDDDSFKIR